jgi:hypothetical protein
MKTINQFLIVLTLLVTNCQPENHKKMTHIPSSWQWEQNYRQEIS